MVDAAGSDVGVVSEVPRELIDRLGARVLGPPELKPQAFVLTVVEQPGTQR